MSCPRNMFLIMASMQLDCDATGDQAMEPFETFVKKLYPGLNLDHKPDKSAIEIYPEPEKSKDEEATNDDIPQMKTEAEMLAGRKAKGEKVPDPCRDVLLAVIYKQKSMATSQSKGIGELFTNVHGFADADFDMDLDCNFHESESLFYDKLGYTKRDEDKAENEEVAKEETKEELKEEEKEKDNKRTPGCETNKPVAFLERPEEVLK